MKLFDGGSDVFQKSKQIDSSDDALRHLDFTSRLGTYVLAHRLMAYKSVHVDDLIDQQPRFLAASKSDRSGNSSVPVGVLPQLKSEYGSHSPQDGDRYLQVEVSSKVQTEAS